MVFQKIAEKYDNLNLFRKIMILFSLVLLAAVLLTSLLFWDRYHKIIKNEMSSIAQKNTDLIAGNLDAMIGNVSYTSKLLLADATIQTLLREGADFGKVNTLREMQATVRNFMNITPYVSSIYVFNTRGNYFGVDYYSYHRFPYARIDDAPWYQTVYDRKGYYVLMVNAGETGRLNGDENVITLVRSIYDLEQASSLLGTLMINTKESLFTSCFANVDGENGFSVTVVDSSFRPVLSGENRILASLNRAEIKDLTTGNYDGRALERDNGRTFYTARKLNNADWYVITAMPYEGSATPVSGIDRFYWLFIVLILFLVFVTATVINHLFTTPIRQLTATMNCVGHGEFRKAEMKTGNDEIGLLKNTYNTMIEQIKTLVVRIKDEGEQKRIAELHALQMQIKPHFLYNTIDMARSLVLTGQTQDVNTVLRSLGQFYRNSISGEKDVITLGEEIDMVKSYLVIQKMRYGDLFEAVYDIDERLLSLLMPKLVLQPLVENAIYHGIRPSGHTGIISIAIWDGEGEVFISVTDNGAGIPPDRLESILGPAGGVLEGEHIGLCGTIARLKLFCKTDKPLEVRSDPGFGTCVTVRIPKENQ
jgi:two-component system sensor histidine kinase YesM